MKTALCPALLLAATATAHAQGGQNYDISITNKTTSTLVQVRATNLKTKRTRELLGGQAIGTGQRVDFDMRDRSNACDYRFRLVFRENGETFNLDRVKNVCTMGNWNIED